MGNVIDLKDFKSKDTLKNRLREYKIDETIVKKVDNLNLDVFDKVVQDSSKYVNTKTLELHEMINKIYNRELSGYETLIKGHYVACSILNMITSKENDEPTEEGKIVIKYLEDFADDCKLLFMESELIASVLLEITYNDKKKQI